MWLLGFGVLVLISALVTELIFEGDINWGTVIAVPIVAVVAVVVLVAIDLAKSKRTERAPQSPLGIGTSDRTIASLTHATTAVKEPLSLARLPAALWQATARVDPHAIPVTVAV